MPSPEQKRKIKTQFEIMAIPFYAVGEDDTRGAKHGASQWQHDHLEGKGRNKRREEKRKSFHCAAMAAG